MSALRLALCILIFSSAPAQAAELPIGWTSVRALGMGNAYISVVDNSDAIFYNPAGLSKVRGVNWTVFDPRAGFNGAGTMELIGELGKISDEMAATINKLYGKPAWAGGGSKTAITIPGIGIAGYANTEAGIFAQNPPNPELNLNYYFDYGIALAAAIDFVPSIWSIGLTARRVNRTGNTSTLGPANLASLDNDALQAELKRRGTGYGLDVGTTIRIPGPVSPSVSFVYRDVGYTTFTHDEGAGAPPRVEPEMLVGGAMTVAIPLASVTAALDYRYMNRTNVPLGKNINFGLEAELLILAVRAGLHQGYYTLGAGLDLGILKADFATYGVELGEFAGQHEDRRYMVQLTIELGFDPMDFGFGGSGGKGGSGGGGGGERRLKRRR